MILFEYSLESKTKFQISEISCIKYDNVEIARGKGSFPCDMSVLDIPSELNWNKNDMPLEEKPFVIINDGSVVYYRYVESFVVPKHNEIL